MTCQEYVNALLEGLAAEDTAGATEHEASCAACRERGASMRAALTGIAALPAGTPPNFARGAMHKVSTARAPWEAVTPPLMDRIAAWLAPMMGQLATAAACLVIGVVVVSSFGKKTTDEAVLAQVKASAGAVKIDPRGHTTTVEVPEVGYAQLAMGAVADVTLRESTRAELRGRNEVHLTAGEVQLDVHHDKVGPQGFRVVTPHGTVHVTGTEFAVRANAQETQVTLYRGSVRFEGRETVTMAAGERLVATPLFVKTITSAARPAWPMLPTSAEAAPDADVAVRASRPPAALPATRATESKASGPPPAATALPEVPPNANVHEPFRP